jgi:hypothetical protein
MRGKTALLGVLQRFESYFVPSAHLLLQTEKQCEPPTKSVAHMFHYSFV